ncbi:glutathione S-transferase family protein [Thalassococcus sp. S3]|uniref:glutathione S-transferase family protein n=1 Tax=Thalassococcus sp. S3 TaxID=2017482 RepID=UPI0010242726|nr:glutathione S-transferase [Thalassococcus sp. S3]QBF32869.1 glutathione S-transferase [Thalassococcus sp. S3]
MTITLFTHPFSRGRTARWMLEEVGASYDVEVVDFDAPRPRALLDANPLGKVPTLIHDGKVITEVAAICIYLADVFPDADLAPHAGETAEFWRWLFFVAGPMEQAATAHAFGWDSAGREANVGFGSYEAVVDLLDAKLSRDDFVAGTRFTAADVCTASFLGWTMMTESIPKRPAFEAYLARCMDRPAARKARAADDALAAEF